MAALDGTIVASATPAGYGGIGVVRISGPDARSISHRILDRSEPLEARRATLCRVRAEAESSPGGIDEVVATWFEAPASYTGEHVVEVSAHGSPVVLRAIVERAIDAGARLARPGEFTLRAFLNGKRDLVQAEAVADLVAAVTPAQARVAFDQLEGTLTRRIAAIDASLLDLTLKLEASLDFPDEGYHFIAPADIASDTQGLLTQLDALLGDARRGRMIREGATVVIAGRPNVGKSSLFNALAGTDRAIVTEVPGTTRDLITERIDLDGLVVTLVDTAGARDTFDIVEREGVLRGSQARAAADLVIVVIDPTVPLEREDLDLIAATSEVPRVVVASKSDLSPAPAGCGVRGARCGVPEAMPLAVSSVSGAGLCDLRERIVRTLTGGEPLRDSAAVSNVRHIRLLEDVRHAVAAAHDAAQASSPEEFVLADLQEARLRLEEIVGARTSDDLLNGIFERFCIGK